MRPRSENQGQGGYAATRQPVSPAGIATVVMNASEGLLKPASAQLTGTYPPPGYIRLRPLSDFPGDQNAQPATNRRG